MKAYGEIAGVTFRRKGHSIYVLATEYWLFDGANGKHVYVNSMTELKDEITNFLGENHA